MQPSSPPKIWVVGSVNMDLVVRCASFPRPGETVTANSYRQIPGGKGANQAIAAVKSAATTPIQVAFVGRVGNDSFGGSLLLSLKEHGVDCTWLKKTEEVETGLAFITVQDDGQNSIAIVAGSNGVLSEEDVSAIEQHISPNDVVLLQLEIPVPTVLSAMRIAKRRGARIVLDPAPIPAIIPPELLQVDLICPNITEAEQLTGVKIFTEADMKSAAVVLTDKGAKTVVLTLGDKGAYLFESGQGRRVEPYHVNPVDTTAAGDSFAGAFAARWLETEDLEESVHWGNAAGAIAASRMGAQPSMGTREEIETLWRTKR